jgi:hypothetical protein
VPARALHDWAESVQKSHREVVNAFRVKVEEQGTHEALVGESEHTQRKAKRPPSRKTVTAVVGVERHC